MAQCEAVEAAPGKVPAALRFLDGRVENLVGRIGVLEERLRPVLTPPLPSSEAEDKPDNEVPMVADIDRTCLNVDVATRLVESLLDRLEV